MDSEIVGGESGGDAETLIVCVAAKGEDAEGAAELGLTKVGRLGFGKSAELAGAALDDVAGHVIGHGGGGSTGAGREREDVEVGEGEVLDDG